jgi:isoquinoline 1-oxidoreductase subunit beta
MVHVGAPFGAFFPTTIPLMLFVFCWDTSYYSATRDCRSFVVGSAAASGGLALGFHLPLGAASAQPQSAAKGVEVNAWVVIKPDDTCMIRIARTEIGQGTRTGLAQLVAEELQCDWKKVTTESITPGQNLARKRVWREMGTGGSRRIRTSEDYVRRGGGAARMMLLQAAAHIASSCRC